MVDSLGLLTIDADELYQKFVKAAQDAVDEPLYPGDERRIFVEALMALLVPTYNSIEDAAEQTCLRYARGIVLDALGERMGVERLAGTAATCVIRFTLSGARDVATVIPKWTNVTADSNVYFATDDDAVISAGQTTVDVPATCTGNGTIGNGYPPGAIATLVDQIAYVSKVANVDESHGGEDGEEYDDEGDDRFRERIRLAHTALSVAGPENAYIYWAKTADPSIIDVSAISETETLERELDVIDKKVYMGGDQLLPDAGFTVDGQSDGFTYTFKDSLLVISLGEGLQDKPKVTVRIRHHMDGRVRIVPLMEGGELPDEDTINRVLDAVNARDVRPMTDVVTVDAPTTVEYNVKLNYWVTPNEEGSIANAVEGDGGVIAQYNSEQCSKLGRDINPDVLKSMIMDAGAIRVEIEEPEWAALEDSQVAKFSGSLTVTHTVETQARWDDE